MKVPVACSLDTGSARAQLQEWADVLGRAGAVARRISPTELALQLGPDLTHLPALVGLAQREKACCPFFTFSLAILADGCTLVVEAPPEATALLDGFGALAPEPSSLRSD